MNAWRRIHIIGGPASGKTTLAERLSPLLRLPIYSLEAIALDDGFMTVRDLGGRLEGVNDIVGKPSWITEGLYLGWTEALLRAAHVIVWLDVRWRTAAWRILSRHVRRSLARANWPAGSGLRNFSHHFRFARRYYLGPDRVGYVPNDEDKMATREDTEQFLKPYMQKVVHCSSRRQIDEFVALAVG